MDMFTSSTPPKSARQSMTLRRSTKTQKKKYSYANEKEFAVEHLIPWDAVTKVQKKTDGKWQDVKITKRAIEFREVDNDEDVEDVEDGEEEMYDIEGRERV